MPNSYYQTLTELEKRNVDRDYIVGWASGFLGSPKKEEQRLTECYEAGYADGSARHTENADKWIAGKVS